MVVKMVVVVVVVDLIFLRPVEGRHAFNTIRFHLYLQLKPKQRTSGLIILTKNLRPLLDPYMREERRHRLRHERKTKANAIANKERRKGKKTKGRGTRLAETRKDF
ncbi:hypothetical protein CRG98_039114 [Punica granatum]|uniref:Secreted protein n=1 Tax=Punica granatum TaxID=22663 RepID=A0A2I0I903_PUNGR|nr:hypothetical protein CRG98_039114 [Punica granatum]